MQRTELPEVRSVSDDRWMSATRARVHEYLESSADPFELPDGSTTTVSTFYRGFIEARAGGAPNDVYLRDHVLRGGLRSLEHDIYQLLGINNWLLADKSSVTMDWFWLFVGDSSTGSSLHLDVMCTPAWNLVLSGRKHWRLFPPTCAVERQLLPESFLEIPGVEQSSGIVTVEQTAGQAVCIPSGWMHVVHNDGPTIALTGNYTDRLSLPSVLHYAERGGQNQIAAQLKRLESALSQ